MLVYQRVFSNICFNCFSFLPSLFRRFLLVMTFLAQVTLRGRTVLLPRQVVFSWVFHNSFVEKLVNVGHSFLLPGVDGLMVCWFRFAMRYHEIAWDENRSGW